MKKKEFLKLKQEVIKILNLLDWKNKNDVDLRSTQSMIDYVKYYDIRSI